MIIFKNNFIIIIFIILFDIYLCLNITSKPKTTKKILTYKTTGKKNYQNLINIKSTSINKDDNNDYINECYTSRTYAYFFNDFIPTKCVPPVKYCISIDGYTHIYPYSFGKGCANSPFSIECDKISYNRSQLQTNQEFNDSKFLQGILRCCTRNLCNFKYQIKYSKFIILFYFIMTYYSTV
ncbi:Hypothetical protein SRAE_X000217200 [Strongyloides ratti]|uniref:Uncharacterized protein n=1 Tax=Strongyloides ratti TaxID=34506 RepID=A0A090KYW6_STRRB|nr:Hypothetical protein SRAE_X000217200 [Strongyloides ratti]CEF60434.1 Hypothetical protein SRAE_X000217200 [Strongyloides ratti]